VAEYQHATSDVLDVLLIEQRVLRARLAALERRLDGPAADDSGKSGTPPE
jgi:hypothetical protein